MNRELKELKKRIDLINEVGYMSFWLEPAYNKDKSIKCVRLIGIYNNPKPKVLGQEWKKLPEPNEVQLRIQHVFPNLETAQKLFPNLKTTHPWGEKASA